MSSNTGVNQRDELSFEPNACLASILMKLYSYGAVTITQDGQLFVREASLSFGDGTRLNLSAYMHQSHCSGNLRIA